MSMGQVSAKSAISACPISSVYLSHFLADAFLQFSVTAVNKKNTNSKKIVKSVQKNYKCSQVFTVTVLPYSVSQFYTSSDD